MQTVVFDHGGASYQFALASQQECECQLFSESYLDQQNLITATISGGRTEAYRFRWQEQELLLKHYRRGGFVRYVTEERYLWTGLNNSRAFREFALLTKLHNLGLPSPVPYACRVERAGWSYTTSLITHWLPNTTSLTERVESEPIPCRHWPEIGKVIRHFHDHSVCHEDLNASNILIDDNDRVFVIDFDKAQIKRSPAQSRQGKAWRYANLKRLQRALMSLSVKTNAFFFTPDIWSQFTRGYLSVDAQPDGHTQVRSDRNK